MRKFSRYQARPYKTLKWNTAKYRKYDICTAQQKSLTKVKLCLRLKLQSPVLCTQVAVSCRRNVGSLSMDMPVDCRTTTLGRHIDRHIGRVSAGISADISVDMSVNMSTNTSRPICRPSVGRHIDWHISRASVDMSTDTRPICRSICRPIYRLRGAQNIQGPTKEEKTTFTSYLRRMHALLPSFSKSVEMQQRPSVTPSPRNARSIAIDLEEEGRRVDTVYTWHGRLSRRVSYLTF